MGSLTTKQLLITAAKAWQKERETFSRQELVKSINEIKYLSAQKKVPRLTLRKKIGHLENKLEGIFELEKNLLKKKKEESAKVSSLKRQTTLLKKKLAACEDKDLQKKVEKLSHFLGEFLSKHGTKIDVVLKKKVMQELKMKEEVKKKKSKKKSNAKPVTIRQKVAEKEVPLDEKNTTRIRELQRRLNALKEELEANKKLEDINPEKNKLIKQKIVTLEEKLSEYLNKHPELLKEKFTEEKPEVLESPLQMEKEVKHTLLFDQDKLILPKAEKKSAKPKKRLPLLPPPQPKRAEG